MIKFRKCFLPCSSESFIFPPALQKRKDKIFKTIILPGVFMEVKLDLSQEWKNID
jgi:hypothetical protein